MKGGSEQQLMTPDPVDSRRSARSGDEFQEWQSDAHARHFWHKDPQIVMIYQEGGQEDHPRGPWPPLGVGWRGVGWGGVGGVGWGGVGWGGGEGWGGGGGWGGGKRSGLRPLLLLL